MIDMLTYIDYDCAITMYTMLYKYDSASTSYCLFTPEVPSVFHHCIGDRWMLLDSYQIVV